MSSYLYKIMEVHWSFASPRNESPLCLSLSCRSPISSVQALPPSPRIGLVSPARATNISGTELPRRAEIDLILATT